MAPEVIRLSQRAGPGPMEGCGMLAGLVAMEASFVAAMPPLHGPRAIWATGGLRAVELLVGWVYWRGRGWRLEDLGLRGSAASRGLAIGGVVAVAFGMLVVLVEAAVRIISGHGLLKGLVGMAPAPAELIALVAVGSGVAPIFEEVFFRGVLYGSLRQRLNVPIATLISVLVFAAAHLLTTPLPWPQTVGAVLFCLAYEWSGSLWAPIVVHATGNLALFLLPLVTS